MFTSSVLSFVKFGGQTFKNVHDVRKVCLETTLSVFACFVEFYAFVFDETLVIGPKLEYEHVWTGQVGANIRRDHS